MSRPQISPWLDHRPKDRYGRPVPFINLWGQQTIDNTYLDLCPYTMKRATFVRENAGDPPNFFKQAPQRQRQCMTEGLCQVCGRFIPWSRRYLVIAPSSVETIDFAGKPRVVVFEPWLDARCAEIAVNWCPALIRRTREEQLTVHPITNRRETRLLASSGWIEGPLEAETKANPVAMWCKLIVLNANIQVQELP